MENNSSTPERRVVIELDNVRRDFIVGSETVHALRGISFKIYEGEFVTIMGTSGSGKSTLLNQLGCLDTPTSGEYYLDGVDFSSATANRPVHNISWYAALAFCNWLSDVSGKNVSLPSENQWIAASLTDTEGGFQKSLMPSASEGYPAAMLGGVWEMTSTRFIPLARISSDAQIENVNAVLDLYGIGTDMVVKGGSYVNDKSEVDKYTIGIITRTFCSPYMGFRVVWD